MTPEDIILKPVLTEKATDGLQPAESSKTDRKAYGKKYTFIVLKSANKTQIKIAVEKMFGVKVEENGQERGLHARGQEGHRPAHRRIERDRVLQRASVIGG